MSGMIERLIERLIFENWHIRTGHPLNDQGISFDDTRVNHDSTLRSESVDHDSLLYQINARYRKKILLPGSPEVSPTFGDKFLSRFSSSRTRYHHAIAIETDFFFFFPFFFSLSLPASIRFVF